ncbi:MAG: hypothetical protein Q7T03_04450 [Deltaproteobacteria bacterium]|nr:hypothetical protein [Deltaproteobacteria bacterium]
MIGAGKGARTVERMQSHQRWLDESRSKMERLQRAQAQSQCASQVAAERAKAEEFRNEMREAKGEKLDVQIQLSHARDCFSTESTPEEKLQCVEKAIAVDEPKKPDAKNAKKHRKLKE